MDTRASGPTEVRCAGCDGCYPPSSLNDAGRCHPCALQGESERLAAVCRGQADRIDGLFDREPEGRPWSADYLRDVLREVRDALRNAAEGS